MREKIMDSQEDEPRVPRSIETATEDRGKLREETLASSESTVKSTENEQDDEMTDDDAQTIWKMQTFQILWRCPHALLQMCQKTQIQETHPEFLLKHHFCLLFQLLSRQKFLI